MRALALVASTLLASVAIPTAALALPEESLGNSPENSSENSPEDRPHRPERWLINFGDSYSKTGFDPDGEQPSAANPIGNPALPGITSTAGLNWIGYLVTEFNNSFSDDETSLTLTYNFGRPGGTVNRHPFGSKNPDFSVQIDWFEKHYVNKERRWTTENAVAGIWFGVNDINGIFAKKLDVRNRDGDLITSLMQDYLVGLERLYSLGLRKYVMLTAPPLSMLPLKLKWTEAKISELNSCVEIWNALLHEKVRIFKKAHKDVVAHVIDTKGPFWDALANPSAYNAPDTTCTDKTGQTCLWFDISHPSTRIMREIAALVAAVLSTKEYRCYGDACGRDDLK